jgi:segregation and condensation protein A
VVVRFLAVLELYKQGWIDLQQVGSLGALTVVWTGRPDDDELDLDDLAFVDAYDG